MVQLYNPKEPNEPPIEVTEEQAISYQGGTQEDPFKGYRALGWTTEKPVQEPVTPPTSEPKTSEPTTTSTTPQPFQEQMTAYDEQTQAYNDYLNSEQKQIESAWNQYVTDTSDAAMAKIASDITAQYQTRFDDLRAINKAIKGNVQTAQYRTGRARYAPELAMGAISAEEKAAQNRISSLTADMNNEIRLAQEAARDQSKEAYAMLATHMDNIRTIQNDRKQAALDALNLAVTMTEVARENAKYQREEMEATAENLASSVYAMMGDDYVANQAVLNKFATEYNIDPNILMGYVNEYQQQEQDNQLALSEKLLDMAKDLPYGQSMEVAEGITITSTKDPDEKWVEEIIGNRKFSTLWRKNADGTYEQVQKIDQGLAWKPTGGGGTTSKDTYFTKPDTSGAVKFYYGNINKMDEAIELTPEEYRKGKSVAEGALFPEEENEFITEDYILKKFDEDTLKVGAKAAGYTAGGFLGIGVGEEGVNDYVTDLMNTVSLYREAGYTDKEIDKMMTSKIEQ